MTSHFRRVKLIKFIQEQERIIKETSDQMDKMGFNGEEYAEPRKIILDRLMQEFGISSEEIRHV